MIVFDAFVASISFFIAYFLRQQFRTFYKLDLFPSINVVKDTTAAINDYLVVFFFIVPFLCAMLYLNGMYRSLRISKLFEIVWIIIKSNFLVMLAFGTIVFLFKLEFVSRLFFVIFLIVSSAFILSEKILVFSVMHYFRKRGYNYRTLLIVGRGKRTCSFIKKIDTANIGMLIDTFHMNIEEASIYGSMKNSRNYISHVHVADSNRWAPGSGHLDFARIIKTLEEIDYKGYISAEILPLPDPDSAARLTIEHLRKVAREGRFKQSFKSPILKKPSFLSECL